MTRHSKFIYLENFVGLGVILLANHKEHGTNFILTASLFDEDAFGFKLLWHFNDRPLSNTTQASNSSIRLYR